MEALNIQLSPFFQWLLKTSLQGSLLICLILLVKTVLRSKLPIRWHYYLWLLLLIRLALPWAPQSRFSMFNLVPKYSSPKRAETTLTTESTVEAEARTTANSETTKDTTEHTIVEQQTVPPKPMIPESELTSTSAPAVPEALSPDRNDSIHSVSSWIVRIFPLAWLLGAITLGSYVAVRNFKLWRVIKRERPVTDSEILDLLEDCKMQINVQTIVGVIVTDRVKSPALFGFVRPRLLLPQGLIEALDFEELRYIFLHELAHLKRRDIYLGWLVSLLQVMHWFNPLIWFALRRMRTDQELACDGLVLSTMNLDEPPKYGRTIVNLFERFSQVSYVPSIAGILEEPSQLERRIKMIAKFKNNSYQWSPLAAVLIVILACISLPDAISTKASDSATSQSALPIMIRRVWADADGNLQGAPSPNGRYISYVDWDTGGDLAIYEIATGKKRRLTNKDTWDESEYAEFSRWSPDGKQIVYDWYNKDDFIELRIVGLDNSKPRILYRNEEVDWAQTYDWSPDGKQILACFSRKDGQEQIVLVSVADGSERILKMFDSKWPDEMCFSPDGHYIVYDFNPKEDYLSRDIFLLSIDGNREVPLVEHPADDRVLGWSPDGKNIIFVSDRTGSPDIWTIGITNGNPRGAPELIKRSKGPFSPIALGFTRDGSFYYGNRTNRMDVYIAEVDPVTGKIIVPPHEAINRFVESNGTPRYSPDGKYLAYVSRRPPMSMRYTTNPVGNVLCVRFLETGEEREFRPEPDINNFGWPRWSPDGRSVMVVAWDMNTHMGYYQIDTQTGNVTPLLQTKGRELHGGHDWSPDGKSIYYGRYDSNTKKYKVCVRDLESGIERGLHGPDERFNISLSPDGRWLALLFSSNVKQSLNVIPTSGGEPRELCRYEKADGIVFGRNCEITWTPDGKYILYTMLDSKSDDPGWALCCISAEGGEPQKLGLYMDEFVNLSVHPDGRHITFSSRGHSSSEVWVMENFLPGTPATKPEPSVSLHRVKTGPMSDFSSPPSLDGRYLCDLGSPDVEGYRSLAIRDLVTGEVRPLTEASRAFPWSPVISPESKHVAYVHQSWFPPKSELQLIKIDGTGHRVLYRLKQDERFHIRAWTPDGKKILGAFKKGSESLQLVTFSIEDGSMQVIYTFDTYWPMWQSPLHKVAISPDGRYIAYDRPSKKGSWNAEIYILDIEHQRAACVVQHPAYDKLLGWTPDGKYIFFSSDRRQGLPGGFTATNTRDAYLLPIEESKMQGPPVLIKSDIPDKLRPKGFTSSGIYHYTVEFKTIETAVAKLDLQTGKLLTKPQAVGQTGAGQIPAWSPDGRHLAYGVHRPDQSQTIRIQDTATGGERELDPNLPHFSWLRWSPDGKSFLVSNFAKNSPRTIYRINTDTGERLTMVQSESSDTLPGEPQLSSDGSILYYVLHHSDSKKANLIARDIKSGHEEELFTLDGTRDMRGLTFALSPDGRHLALATQVRASSGVGADKRISIMPAKGGEPRELLKPERRITMPIIAWTPDGQALLFTKHIVGKGTELWLVPTGEGQAHKLCNPQEMMCQGMMYGAVFSALDVHPDGKHIAFDCFEYRHEVWAMENFLPKAVASAEK